MNKKQLKKLKSRLPRGYVKIIVSRSGVSRATVNRFFNGGSPNERVLNVAIELAAETDDQRKSISSKIDSL